MTFKEEKSVPPMLAVMDELRTPSSNGNGVDRQSINPRDLLALITSAKTRTAIAGLAVDSRKSSEWLEYEAKVQGPDRDALIDALARIAHGRGYKLLHDAV